MKRDTSLPVILALAALVAVLMLSGCATRMAATPLPTEAQVQTAMRHYRVSHPQHCEICGKPASEERVLEVHHIRPRERFPAMAADETNFILVCRPCHQWVCHPGDFGYYTDNLREWLSARQIKENKR